MLQADGAQLVLWERAGTLLAVPLEDVVEIAAVDTAGVARGRAGEVELLQVPGIAMGARPARAVVVRRGERFGGLPADLVRGVQTGGGTLRVTPPWLGSLVRPHVRGLLPLDDQRLAAVIDVEAVLPDQ